VLTKDAPQPEQLHLCPSQRHHELQVVEPAPFSGVGAEALRLPAAVELAVAAVEEAVQAAEADAEQVLAAAGEAVDWWKLAAAVQDVAADQSVAPAVHQTMASE